MRLWLLATLAAARAVDAFDAFDDPYDGSAADDDDYHDGYHDDSLDSNETDDWASC